MGANADGPTGAEFFTKVLLVGCSSDCKQLLASLSPSLSPARFGRRKVGLRDYYRRPMSRVACWPARSARRRGGAKFRLRLRLEIAASRGSRRRRRRYLSRPDRIRFSLHPSQRRARETMRARCKPPMKLLPLASRLASKSAQRETSTETLQYRRRISFAFLANFKYTTRPTGPYYVRL